MISGGRAELSSPLLKIYNKKIKKELLEKIEKNLFPIEFLRLLIRSYVEYLNEIKFANNLQITSFFESKYLQFVNNNDKENFFVLGGSQSINKISSDQWRFISSQVSLGINKWFVHRFVPSMLMVEGYKKCDLHKEKYTWINDNLINYLSNEKLTVLVKDISKSHLRWNDLRKSNQEIYSIPKLKIPGRSNLSFKKSLLIMKKFGLHNIFNLFSRTSIIQAISLGQILGYKKIILCGVDLNDNKYFWSDNNFVCHEKTSIPNQDNKIINEGFHETSDLSLNKLTAEYLIKEFNNIILKESNIKLYVLSNYSVLYPDIPLYTFPL